MNKNLKKHWALAACALCLSGLHAQWDFAATSAAADTTVMATNAGDESKPTTYQEQVLSALDQKKIVLFSLCDDVLHSETPLEVQNLDSLIRTGYFQLKQLGFCVFF